MGASESQPEAIKQQTQINNHNQENKTTSETAFIQFKEENYTFIKSVNENSHPFGECKVYADQKSGLQIALVSIIIPNRKKLAQMIEKYEKYQTLSKQKNTDFVRLEHIFVIDDWSLIGSNFTLQLQFQYVYYTLASDYEYRIRETIHYTEESLWCILYYTLSALCALKRVKRSHSDLTPKNIFITEVGEIKLMDPSLKINLPMKHMKKTIYQLRNEKDISQFKNQCYLSPTLFNRLKFKDAHPSVQPLKDDAFSLGIIMLECALLQKVSASLYDTSTYTFNEQELKRMLQVIRKTRSRQFSGILEKLLQIDEFTRSDAEILFLEVEHYQSTKDIPPIPHALRRMIGNVSNVQLKENSKKLANQLAKAFFGKDKADQSAALQNGGNGIGQFKAFQHIFGLDKTNMTSVVDNQLNSANNQIIQNQEPNTNNAKSDQNSNASLFPQRNPYKKNNEDAKFRVQGQLDMLDEKIRVALLNSQNTLNQHWPKPVHQNTYANK